MTLQKNDNANAFMSAGVNIKAFSSRKCLLGISLLALFLTSCGFHLRGMVNIPQWLNHVAIINQTNNPNFDPFLKKQLEAYHIQVSPDPAIADYRLIIQNDTFQQNISSVSSSTAARQYQLIYTTSFKLLDKRGKEVIPTSHAFVSRQITINSDRILGSNFEEAITKKEMTRDAVMQILSRLSRE